MAASQLRMGQPQAAKQRYLEAYELVDGWNRFFTASALNELGMLYQKTGQPDSAAFYFHKALGHTTASEIKDTFLLKDLRFAIHDNLGLLEESRGQDKLAREHYMSNLNQAALVRNAHSAQGQACFRLSNLALQNGQFARPSLTYRLANGIWGKSKRLTIHATPAGRSN